MIRSPRSSLLGLLFVASLLFTPGCPRPMDGTCRITMDCPANQVCRNMRCEGPSDGGMDGTVDDARPDVAIDREFPDISITTDAADASFVGLRCNEMRACPGGYVCDQGICVVDCGANARCGDDLCCDTGQVCYLGACTTPGSMCGGMAMGMCAALSGCPMGQQCEPSVGRCLTTPPSTGCNYTPSASFDPQPLWTWTASVRYPTFRHVMATPIVADVNNDGISDIVVPVTDRPESRPTTGGILCALSGAGDCAGSAREIWCTSPDEPRVNYVSPVAIGDLDGTGTITIVAIDARRDSSGNLVSGVVGYDSGGFRIANFGTDTNGNPVDIPGYQGAPAIADLDGDGHAEVFVGFTVFDSRGRLLWQRPGATGNAGTGAVSVAADLNADGRMEVIGGNMAYHADGTPAWPTTAPARAFEDGWPAVADFDADGLPEVVSVARGQVRIFDREGRLFSASAATVSGNGGAPTIADVNADGTPEIALAGSSSLTVFRVGAGIDHRLGVLWRTPADDLSSSTTGASVFDFDGDGRAEVIYADECYARVYDGRGDGRGSTSTLFALANTSCTGTEYPVVADVTGDGKAEFIVVSNDATGLGTDCTQYADRCGAAFAGYRHTNGVRVFRDRRDNWVATRNIWNQASYHVTNVCDGRDSVCPSGSNRHAGIPRSEPASWSFPMAAPLNRYRVNGTLEQSLAASDLVPRNLRADLSECSLILGLRAQVLNQGDVGSPMGVPVSFYRLGAGGSRTLIGTTRTTRVLLPGASEAVSVQWNPVPPDARGVNITVEVVIDDDGMNQGITNECNERNNRVSINLVCDDLG